MVRTFTTNIIRPQIELTQLWSFTPLSTEKEPVPQLVGVPSCWESYPGFGLYRGKAAYKTSFTGAGNFRIVCKGVSHTASVFVDEEKIADHYNAYTTFSGIATCKSAGEHSLRIEVSNEFSEDSALHIPNDYMSYGGITRPVIVESVPDVFIEWVHATPEYSGGVWSLRIDTKLRNIGTASQEAKVRHKLGNQETAAGEVNVPAGGYAVIKTSQKYNNVSAYELENPTLYMLETLLFLDDVQNPIDDLIERVGFRIVRVEGKQILFNDKQIHIKGFCRHEDHPQFGCALPFQAMDYDLNVMKDLGVNSVRTSHYPNDELFLDLCDEKGILVWEENHARGLDEEKMRNPNFHTQCNDCICAMIDDHFNHPSIIIWGILNECASHTEYGKECYEEQFALIKSMDASRPTSFASCRFFTDLCLGFPDIISYNIYPEWYHYPEWPVDNSTPTMMKQIYEWVQTTEGAGKPFIVGEVGAGAIYGNRNPHHAKWSEERQVDILTAQLTYLLNYENCAGLFIWQFCDCRVSEEWFAQRPRVHNNKGIVDEYRRPKLSYHAVKSAFSSHGNYLNP